MLALSTLLRSAYRDRRVRRTLHDLGNPLTGRPRELIVIYSQHYCTRCRKYFNADMTDLATPGSHSTKRVVDTAVRLVIEDGLPYRAASWSLGAITASSFLTPRSRTGSRTGGKRHSGQSPPITSTGHSPTSRAISPLTSCMTARSVSCRSSNRTFKRLSYHVLDRDPTQVDIEAFFRRFRQALEARGLTVQGITTDGSTLYPEPIAAVFGAVPHQVCQFHILHGEQGDPLGRGPGTQASGSRCPQIAAGPSQLKGGQACRSAQEADQAEGG